MQHPLGEFGSESGLFDQWNELFRRGEFARRILPTGQRLKPDEFRGSKIHLRLKVGYERTVLDRSAQIRCNPRSHAPSVVATVEGNLLNMRGLIFTLVKIGSTVVYGV